VKNEAETMVLQMVVLKVEKMVAYWVEQLGERTVASMGDP
jgi:hypothetical protein